MKDEKAMNNKNPDRVWCEGQTVATCTRSTYKLEGKLPIGVALANKLRDSDKKVSDTIEFESEMRILSAPDIYQNVWVQLLSFANCLSTKMFVFFVSWLS